jgi:hypothetical protein
MMLSVAALAEAFTGSPQASPAGVIASNTAASWSMEEPPGATTLVDSSGNGRHGTIAYDVTTGALSPHANIDMACTA